jgi:hypothetical protein
MIPQPAANHNGGMLAFGPDGYLYAGVGDGGGAGDPSNYAQSRTTLLGKLLRLDVDSGSPYAVPADNPFVGDPDPAVRTEIWAYGLRNPWRFSFDSQNGDLYVGDVGQGSREEIDHQPGGAAGGDNYGWRVMEGSQCYNPSSGCNTSGKVLPIAEYGHVNSNCSVTGGYVYRGLAQPAMSGIYLFGDFCSGRMWASAPLDSDSWTTLVVDDTDYNISSFGVDESDELYLTDYGAGEVIHILGPQPSPTPTPTAIPPRPTATGTINPGGYPTADVNQDSLVNIVDVQITINVILGTETQPTALARSDVNQDGRVDVLDTQLVINVILAG